MLRCAVAHLGERGGSGWLAAWLLFERVEQAQQPAAVSVAVNCRLRISERRDGELVASLGGDVADGEGDAFGDIPLSSVGGAEGHGGGGVEQKPGVCRPFCDVGADMWFSGSCCHVPVDPADVVTDHVG